MLPIQRLISAYNWTGGNKPYYIVIHDVGTKYSTAYNNVVYFSGGNRNASAHLFVDDSSIWQSVEFGNGSWHVGDGGNMNGINNLNSIGIEMCLPNGTVSAKTEENTVELVKYLMKAYGIPASRVVRHYDASNKRCPGEFAGNNWARWNAFKAKLSGAPSVVTPTHKGDVMKKTLKYINTLVTINNDSNWYATSNLDDVRKDITPLKKGEELVVHHALINDVKWPNLWYGLAYRPSRPDQVGLVKMEDVVGTKWINYVVKGEYYPCVKTEYLPKPSVLNPCKEPFKGVLNVNLPPCIFKDGKVVVNDTADTYKKGMVLDCNYECVHENVAYYFKDATGLIGVRYGATPLDPNKIYNMTKITGEVK